MLILGLVFINSNDLVYKTNERSDSHQISEVVSTQFQSFSLLTNMLIIRVIIDYLFVI